MMPAHTIKWSGFLAQKRLICNKLREKCAKYITFAAKTALNLYSAADQLYW